MRRTDSALHDPARLAALHDTGLLDAPPEPALDRLARLAARVLHAPIAVVTMVDAERQFFAGGAGLPEPWASSRQTALSHSFCRHVIGADAPLVVEDARTHPLVRDNPAILDVGAVAYLGVPLATADGEVLGALAVIDRTPRVWSDDDGAILTDLAASVMTELELRRELRRGQHNAWALAEAQRLARIGSWELDVATGRVRWSAEMFRLSGLEARSGTISLEEVQTTLHPEDREWVWEEVERHALAGQPCELTYRVRCPDGTVRTLHGRAESVGDPASGRHWVVGTAQDVTQRVRTEAALRESQARLAEAQRVARIGSWAVDAAVGTVWWSDELFHLFGRDPAEGPLAIDDFASVVHPDDQARVRLEMAAYLATQARFEIEFRVVRPDGSIRMLREHGQNTFGPDGTLLSVVGTVQDVTERALAEIALRESEDRFRLAAEATRDMIFDADLATGHVVRDGAVEEITGRPAATIPATMAGWLDLVHPADLTGVAIAFEEACAGNGDRWGAEYRMQRENGDAVHVHERARILRDEHGRARRVVGAATDITARHIAEAARGASEARYRTLVESAHEGIWALDAVGRTTYVNPRMVELLGYPPDTILGSTLFDFMAPDQAFEARTLFARRQRGIAETDEFTFYRADGTKLRATVSASPLYEDRGEFSGALALVSDVTERREAEERLQQSERYFRALIENTAELILVLDANGRLVYGSPAYQRLLGIAPGEVLGQDALGLVHPQDLPSVEALFAELLHEPGGVRRAEYRAGHRDGTWRVVSTVAQNLLHEPAVAGIVVNARDVTETRAIQAQFRQAQKMEAVGQLAGGVAHDFNNLLTVITAATRFARKALPVDAPVREELAAIDEAADRAAQLTRQLLAFSRKQLLRPEVLDPNQVVAGVERMLRRLIGEDITVLTVLEPRLRPVLADPGQLEQVLLNLAVNARDAMPNGGQLVLATANVDLTTADAVRRGADAPPGAYVRLTVRDSGDGMDEATLSRIFEPFFTTKEPGRGTGLGLSTAYGIVKQSGGFVWVTSAPGAGTTFEIDLPAAAVQPEPFAVPSRSPVAPGTETVLLVEDDAPVRAVVCRILAQKGYMVLEAPDGAGALDLLERHDGPIDLILTDAVMPGMSGRAVADEARRRRPGVPVLFMSGYTDDEILRRGLLAPGLDLVEKPFTAERLLEAVRAMLDDA